MLVGFRMRVCFSGPWGIRRRVSAFLCGRSNAVARFDERNILGQERRVIGVDRAQRIRHIAVWDHDINPQRSQVTSHVIHKSAIQNVPFERLCFRSGAQQ